MSVNVPTNNWQDNRGDTEYSNGGVYFIADTTGALLVDTTAADIVDTGVLVSTIPSTVWSEDDSK